MNKIARPDLSRGSIWLRGIPAGRAYFSLFRNPYPRLSYHQMSQRQCSLVRSGFIEFPTLQPYQSLIKWGMGCLPYFYSKIPVHNQATGIKRPMTFHTMPAYPQGRQVFTPFRPPSYGSEMNYGKKGGAASPDSFLHYFLWEVSI